MLVTITILAAVVGVFLILAVLIQNPKGGGVDSTFGGQASTQLFGAAQSADLIEKITWYLCAGLFVLCILASLLAGSPAAQ